MRSISLVAKLIDVGHAEAREHGCWQIQAPELKVGGNKLWDREDRRAPRILCRDERTHRTRRKCEENLWLHVLPVALRVASVKMSGFTIRRSGSLPSQHGRLDEFMTQLRCVAVFGYETTWVGQEIGRSKENTSQNSLWPFATNCLRRANREPDAAPDAPCP